jgi:hypothetical protein
MTNNKQQTAVEWLFDKMFDPTSPIGEQINWFDQAKAMHREEQGKTWDKSMDNLDARGGNIVRAYVDFDDYYKQTYGEP